MGLLGWYQVILRCLETGLVWPKAATIGDKIFSNLFFTLFLSFFLSALVGTYPAVDCA